MEGVRGRKPFFPKKGFLPRNLHTYSTSLPWMP